MFDKVLVLFLVFSFIAGILLIFWDSPLEYLFLDWKFMLTNSTYKYYDFSEHLVLVTIDNYSEDKLGIPIEEKGWRRLDPAILKLLHENGAVVIGYDIQFSGETTVWDEALADSFEKYAPVISSEEKDGSTLRQFKEKLFDITSASVRSVRGLPRLVYKYPNAEEQMAFSYKAVSIFSDRLGIDRSGDPGYFRINYKYPRRYFPAYSYADLLTAHNGVIGNREETSLSVFNNKIILIAKEYEKDKIGLPNLPRETYFGGLVHAYAIETLLSESYIRPIPLYVNITVFLLLLLVLHVLLAKTAKFGRIFFVALFYILVWSAGLWLFREMNYWMNFSAFFLGGIILVAGNIIYKRRVFMKNFLGIKKEMGRLEQYNKILEQAGRMRDILTDTIVHDIKNSIAAVEGSLIYVAEKYKEDKYTLRTFHAANIACQDIINLSSNLLDIRKMEEGKQDFQKEKSTFDYIKCICDRYSQYPLFFEKKIDVSITEPGFPFKLYADNYLLEQIIHNLLNNGLKYTPTGGYIHISFEQTVDEVILSFFNNGQAISETQKQKIFRKYIRLGKGRSRYSKGLGLYFCKMAMELHGGRIWIVTADGGNYFKLGFRHDT